ncbi:GAF and ANTAR domain-containing protein [Intrasporangium calvum]|uniref:GAF and ANTAR domain-containing protein n=1 Tax=Intrasporangium calvum TaxID=53358 RepID=A0ABT5GH67_9MICO|nr:GAF and ANTAR domain-containing protein [Intrasporangium calvum]MDC5697603.1 GAF and ANTAR domain-containing protein [Intrasporangium calvum]
MTQDLPDDEGMREVFVRLSGLIYAGADESDIHQAIVDAAVRLVDGCEHASIMLRRNDRFSTAAGTDEVARRADAIEREVREGPCFDAVTEESFQHDADLTDGSSPWPRFTERVLAETPVRSAIGYRILLDGDKVGALNLFADRPGALTEQSADQGAVLASFASVALMALKAREEAATLRLGLRSNREIGKAVGLLMAAHHMNAEQAFQVLRRTSQELNMKLTQVAEQVVRGQEQQFGPGSRRDGS